ncbi:MAG: flagellar hook-basal body complex protein FliE [Bdellovibrionaceae bacterium]|nr:flagellar hook-basal body complex protein FliE [Pseudobdellovibrionaceae bacterium]
MDGLTIRQGQSLLNQGKTASEIRADDFSPRAGSTGSAASGVGSTGANGKIDGGGFADILRDAINETNELQKQADVKTQDLATGKTTNIPEVMMTVEKADIALRLMTQVRNKIIDAYQEVMKMQV